MKPFRRSEFIFQARVVPFTDGDRQFLDSFRIGRQGHDVVVVRIRHAFEAPGVPRGLRQFEITLETAFKQPEHGLGGVRLRVPRCDRAKVPANALQVSLRGFARIGAVVVADEVQHLGLAVVDERHAHRLPQHRAVLEVQTFPAHGIACDVAAADIRDQHHVYLHHAPLAILVLIAVWYDARTVGGPQRVSELERFGRNIGPIGIFEMLLAVAFLRRQHFPAPCVRVVIERRRLHGNNTHRLHVSRIELPQFPLGILFRASGIQPVGHNCRLVGVHLHHFARGVVYQFELADDPAVIVAVFARDEPLPELAGVLRNAADLLAQTVSVLDPQPLEGRFGEKIDTQNEEIGLRRESEPLVFVPRQGTFQKTAPGDRNSHLPGLILRVDRQVSDLVLLVIGNVGIVDQKLHLFPDHPTLFGLALAAAPKVLPLDGADQLLFRGQHVPVAGRFPVRDMVVVVVVLPALAAPTPGLALLFAQEEIRLIGNLPPRGRKGGFVALYPFTKRFLGNVAYLAYHTLRHPDGLPVGGRAYQYVVWQDH